jgi:hypothetical protein
VIPSVWVFALLTLAAFRVWRLLAIDTFPPVEKVRNRLLFPDGKHLNKPLAEFLKCSYCSGFWVTLIWYLAWLLWPHAAVVAAVPFALSAVVGAWSARFDS